MMIPPHHVAISPAPVDQGGFLELLLRAQKDPLLDGSSLPHLKTPEAALQWLFTSGWTVWVARVNGVAAGLFSTHLPNPGMELDAPAGYLEYDLYIAPAFRGQGLAVHALNQLERDYLPSGTTLIAEVWTDNTPSIALFRRMGWAFAGDHKRTDGDNAGECQRFMRVVPQKAF